MFIWRQVRRRNPALYDNVVGAYFSIPLPVAETPPHAPVETTIDPPVVKPAYVPPAPSALSADPRRRQQQSAQSAKEVKKEEDQRRLWIQKREQVLRKVALTGCTLKNPESATFVSTLGVFARTGPTITVPGYKLLNGYLYVDLGGIFVDSDAAGSSSNQAYAKMTVVNVSGIAADTITDTFAGRPVVWNLCGSGSLTLYREINPFRDGNQVTYQYVARGKFPDGSTGTAQSPSMSLSQFRTSHQNGQNQVWQIQFQKFETARSASELTVRSLCGLGPGRRAGIRICTTSR